MRAFCLGILATLAAAGAFAQPTEDDYYTLTTIPVPEGITL